MSELTCPWFGFTSVLTHPLPNFRLSLNVSEKILMVHKGKKIFGDLSFGKVLDL